MLFRKSFCFAFHLRRNQFKSQQEDNAWNYAMIKRKKTKCDERMRRERRNCLFYGIYFYPHNKLGNRVIFCHVLVRNGSMSSYKEYIIVQTGNRVYPHAYQTVNQLTYSYHSHVLRQSERKGDGVDLWDSEIEYNALL